MRVQHDQHRAVAGHAPHAGRPGPAIQQHAEAAEIAVVPIAAAHLLAAGIQPAHVADAGFRIQLAGQIAAAAEDGVAVAQRGQFLDEFDQPLAAFADVPVEPAGGVVLVVGVVVAALGPAELVPRQQHGRALAQQQRGQHVADLPLPQGVDGRVVRRPFDAAIPADVIAGPVLVVLAIRLVVLVVVGDGVVQREPVMRGDEIHRRPGPPPAPVELPRRGGQTPGHDGHRRLRLPERASCIAELVVPFGPARRELPHLVAAGPDIPRLGDQLDG